MSFKTRTSTGPIKKFLSPANKVFIYIRANREDKKMTPIKIIGIAGALLALLVFSGIAYADSSLGYSISGSSMDVSGVSLSSTMGASSAGGYASPSALLYKISANGFGTTPAMGSMSAFLNYNSMTPSSNFAYTETASATGLISSFSKTISVTF
jgi:hypothetical protein